MRHINAFGSPKDETHDTMDRLYSCKGGFLRTKVPVGWRAEPQSNLFPVRGGARTLGRFDVLRREVGGSAGSGNHCRAPPLGRGFRYSTLYVLPSDTDCTATTVLLVHLRRRGGDGRIWLECILGSWILDLGSLYISCVISGQWRPLGASGPGSFCAGQKKDAPEPSARHRIGSCLK